MSNPPTALVTGGAGFIGSHLVDRLLAQGHHVTVVDNFITGRMSNLTAASQSPNLSICQADITDYQALSKACQDQQWVFHLAGMADIVPSIQQPLAYHQVNVMGTVALLEAARNAGAQRVVYAASSSCYGIPDIYPTPETAPIKPMYPYALSKYLGEECVLHWNKVYSLPTIALRLFNVFGPRSRTSGAYGAVFGVFLAQKLAGKPMTVVGDGEQTRDFTYVADVVDALMAAADSSVSGEAMNVGTGRPVSVNYLTSLLGGDVVQVAKRPGEPDCTMADVTKIQQLLGWQAHTPFETGVKVMLDDIENWRDAPVWNPESIQEATRDWFTYLKEPSTLPGEIRHAH